MKEFRKTKEGSFICEECGASYIGMNNFSRHISIHYNKKEYFDKWIKEEKDDECKICKNITKFEDIKNGYLSTCCKKCKDIYCYELNKIGMIKKYGVNHNFKRKKVREKVIKNNRKKRLYPFYNKTTQKKIKENNFKKYGVENQFQREEIKEKRIISCINHFGTESPAQNTEIFEKIQKNSFKLKQFKNTNIWYQASYELDFLEKYYYKYPNIVRGPSLHYQFEGKNRVYHPDFYISSLNLIIECKNLYLMKKDKQIIEAKEKAVISNGFKYLVIVDKNYIDFNNY